MIALCALVSACGSDGSPTGPSGSASYRGEWIGTTAQGAPMSFTISADEKVTSITIGHNFNSCAGSQTFSNLSLDTIPNVTCIPAPCPTVVSGYRQFSYVSGTPGSQSTSINGLFPSTVTAQGLVHFNQFPVCGTALSVSWTAVRR